MNDHEVVIVGAGFSGLGLGIQLRKADITDFVILDGADDVGGVWHHNRYPGIAVDIPSSTYSYSFEPNPNWSRLFAPGTELKAYARHCVEKYHLAKHLRLKTSVEKAVYDDDLHRWELHTSGGVMTSRYLVSAVGPLDRPKLPDIPGLDAFAGQKVHTARWDDSVQLGDKRVAIIGTGATSLQLVPEVAKVATHLDVYQRTPIWVLPKPNTDIPPAVQRLFRRVPPTQRVLRFGTTVLAEFVMTAGVVYHTRYPFLIRWVEGKCLAYLKEAVEDPEIRAKLTPDYAFGCKRPSFSGEYLQSFNRANVELVTDRIVRIVPEGIVTQSAGPETGEVTEQVHEIDTLLLATGFKVMQLGAVPAFPIYGREGVEIGEYWDENRYQNYEGISTPLVPNFWLMSGPWSVAGPSWFAVIESGSRHIVRCLTEARRRRATRMVVTQRAHDDYMKDMRKKVRRTAFVQPTCLKANSYYFDRHGDAPFVRPVSGPALTHASKTFNLDDYEYSRLPKSATPRVTTPKVPTSA